MPTSLTQSELSINLISQQCSLSELSHFEDIFGDIESDAGREKVKHFKTLSFVLGVDSRTLFSESFATQILLNDSNTTQIILSCVVKGFGTFALCLAK